MASFYLGYFQNPKKNVAIPKKNVANPKKNVANPKKDAAILILKKMLPKFLLNLWSSRPNFGRFWVLDSFGKFGKNYFENF